MSKWLLVRFCLIVLPVAAITGCGSNSTGNGGTVSALEASQPCIGCHSTAVSPVTGAGIVDEWRASTHNTRNGAGCRDCHEPAAGHPNNCATCHGGGTTPPGTDEVVRNPDDQQKCYTCHAPNSTVHPLTTPHFARLPATVLVAPQTLWDNMTTASYVSSRNAKRCRSCHNPHDNSVTPHHKDWAESAHGNTLSQAFMHYDFKVRGTSGGAKPATSVASDCVRCHTSTGYIRYVTSGFTNISAWGRVAPGTPLDKTKEVIGCATCHDDGQENAYSYRIRNVSGITGYYNYSSVATKKVYLSFPYPDLGASNICVGCHAGREIGDTIKTAAANNLNFANAGFINSHYLTAGSTVFGISGYTFTGRSYDNAFFQHDQIGRGNFLGTGTRGPCVTCHMSSPNKHHFLPVTRQHEEDKFSPITTVTSTACNYCHSQKPWTGASLQERKAAYQAALDALKDQLANRGFYFQTKNPYFFTTPTGSTRISNWKSAGDTSANGRATGEQNMGAAFNYNLLEHDPGAFAHNSFYVKRLIYDSVDWLDDNQLNNSVGSTLNALPDSTPYKTDAIRYLLQ